jgi:hypothetical protein
MLLPTKKLLALNALPLISSQAISRTLAKNVMSLALVEIARMKLLPM